MEEKFGVGVGDELANDRADAFGAGVPVFGVVTAGIEAGDSNVVVLSQCFLEEHATASPVRSNGDEMEVGLF